MRQGWGYANPIKIAVLLLAALLVLIVVASLHFRMKATADAKPAATPLIAAKPAAPAEAAPLDVYGKIKAGSDLRILIVGDSIGAGEGAHSVRATWFYDLVKALQDEYGVHSYLNTLSTGSETVLDGLVDYQMTNTSAHYDLVFLCFGYQDQHALTLQKFSQAYEQLIRAVKTEQNNPEVYVMIENAMTDDAYTGEIRRLADHYGLGIVDARGAFAASGLSNDRLTDDGVHPNAAGYAVYKDAILTTLAQSLKDNKPVAYGGRQPLQPLEGNPVLLHDFSMTPGFRRSNNIYWSGQANERLSLPLSGRPLGIMVYQTTESGLVDVYLDGRYLTELNCYGPNRVKIYWLTESVGDNPQQIELEVTGKKSDASSGTKVGIVGVVAD